MNTTMTEIFELCGGKDNWAKYYGSFADCVKQFIKDNDLKPSEQTFDILKTISEEVVEDIGEGWYRNSLGKVQYH